MSPIGSWLRHYRTEHNLTLKQFAKELGITHTYLCALERSKKRKPSKKLLDRIINYCGLNQEQIAEIQQAAEASDTLLKLPENAKPSVFYIVHKFIECADVIHDRDIELIKFILDKGFNYERREERENVCNY